MKEWLIIFAQFAAVIFIGFVLANVCVVAISVFSAEFDSFLPKILQLPYLFYLITSIVLAAILATVVLKKNK